MMISLLAMTFASEVSFTSVMTSLPIGGQDALDDLQERDLEKDLAPGHAQHLTGLGLAFRHILDAAAVDLREVAGVVDGERYAAATRRPLPPDGHGLVKPAGRALSR